MILLSDPRIGATTVADNGEKLVDLRPYLLVDSRQADAGGAYARVRQGVCQRLLCAQSTLPKNVRLLIIEGYRSLEDQQAIFDGYLAKLRRLHPQWSNDRLHIESSKFVSPVEVAPHSTGAAIDLTLCTLDGIELDMGTSVDATPVDSDNACFTAAANICAAARKNRQVLTDALTEVGLVNYPTEWWHWSYGDRYWAAESAANTACYGPVPRRSALSKSHALPAVTLFPRD